MAGSGKTITGRIYARLFELLEENPGGLRWSELLARIEAENPGWHPKTVNGCIWKVVEKYSDLVYKPAKGVFRLIKFKSVTV